MRKQKYSLQLKPPSKYNPTFNHFSTNNKTNKPLRHSFDHQIGLSRIPQSSLVQHKYTPSKHSYSYQQEEETKTSKTKRQAYSTTKIQHKRKIINFKLPQIRNSTFFQNPQENKSLTLNKNKPNNPNKLIHNTTTNNKPQHIYYQTSLYNALNNHSKSPNYILTLATNHFPQTIQALKIGKHIKISPNPQTTIKLPKKYPHFKTVFLDLDQTLIHCDQNATNYTVKLDFPIQAGTTLSAGIRVRPHCKQFLQELSSFAQIIIFTASSASYADVVLKYLDPNNKLISHKLYRHNCTLQKGYYVKDLRTVNRRLEDSVLVDNSAYCYMLQPFNGIPILPYYHYHKDKQLLNLLAFLKEVLKSDDVRVPIKKTFFWNKYFENDNDPRKIFQSHFQQIFHS